MSSTVTVNDGTVRLCSQSLICSPGMARRRFQSTVAEFTVMSRGPRDSPPGP